MFNGEELHSWLAQRTARAVHQVKTLNDSELLAQPIDDLVAQLYAEYDVELPRLLTREQEAVETGSGAGLELRVPLEGDPGLLRYRPNVFTTSGPPQGRVEGMALILPLGRAQDLKGGQAGALAPRLTAEVQKWIDWQAEVVDRWRPGLYDELNRLIRQYVQRAQSHHEALGDLGLPLRRRDDAPRTFASDAVVRRKTPVADQSVRSQGKAGAATELQPELTSDLYEHIVRVVRSAGRAMERAPMTYAGWGEEDRRQVLLLMLNSHYAGRAHAEAFNAGGKTDLLLREADRNLFIGECKMWDGPKVLTDTVDQLFDYTTWRDVKLAIIMFVDRRDFTAVIASARRALDAHPQFVARLSMPDNQESEFRAQMSWPGDAERKVTLQVSLFNTPRGRGTG